MNQYLDLYRAQRDVIAAHSVPLLNARRDEAAEAFARAGFPSRRDEDYRYTDVAAAFAPDYGLRLDAPANPASLPGAAAQYYGTLADVHADALTALNTMFAQDITVVHVPAGVRREHPVRLTSVSRSAVPLMQNRRLLVVAEAGARVQLLLDERPDEQQDFLVTQVTEVFVGEGARVEFYDIETAGARCRRFHQFAARVDAGGQLTHAAFSLRGGLSRARTDVVLAGEGAEATLLGCVVADGKGHVDMNTLVDHRASGCTSRQLYKYVLEGSAEGAFAGRILVREQAQKTRSQETNANLVCTPEARMWTQPMLEIYADDVQCSHGSTVGQLADDALFYMRQRGIAEDEARMLLKQAFASEVIDAVPLLPLRRQLHHLVEKRFRSCGQCHLCDQARPERNIQK